MNSPIHPKMTKKKYIIQNSRTYTTTYLPYIIMDTYCMCVCVCVYKTIFLTLACSSWYIYYHFLFREVCSSNQKNNRNIFKKFSGTYSIWYIENRKYYFFYEFFFLVFIQLLAFDIGYVFFFWCIIGIYICIDIYLSIHFDRLDSC